MTSCLVGVVKMSLYRFTLFSVITVVHTRYFSLKINNIFSTKEPSTLEKMHKPCTITTLHLKSRRQSTKRWYCITKLFISVFKCEFIIVLRDRSLTLGCLRGFFEGGKSMGGSFWPYIKKTCLITKYWLHMSLNDITEWINLF